MKLPAPWLRALGIGALSLGLTLIITQPTGAGVRVTPGDTAKTTYKSPRTVTYKSDLKTAEAETRATSQVAPLYRPDPTAPSQQEAKLAATLTAITAVRAEKTDPSGAEAHLRQVVPNLTMDQSRSLLTLPEGAWGQAQGAAREALGRLQQGRITADDLGRAEALLGSQLPNELPTAVRNAAALVGSKVLVPNYIIDEEATDAAKTKAKNSVQPIYYTVERDQVVASRSQVLSDFDVEQLQAIGLTRPAFSWQKSLGVFFLVLIFAATLLYLTPRLTRDPGTPRRMVGLLALFAVGITLAGVLVIPTQPILAYVLPVAAAALLLALFYGFPAALVGGISLTALYALAAGGSFELFFIHLAAILVILPFARRINRTVRFLQAGAGVALVVFIGMIAFSLLSANFSLTNLPKFLLAAGLNGALTASVVFAGAAFLGSALGITTFLQLLELENPRQGLLRRLAGEAPGTYSHSLRMAGLVEAAAERIGADALLARVQALYHDIGKTAMPEYFVENQRGTNPHLKLTPKESAEILRAHVSEGLALAAAAGLPEPVAAAIPEHHGTSLMAYFWETAKKRGGRPRETDFRYLGPKPHSKETAIIMLADAVESASRTLERPDEDSVKQLIHRLFTDRIDDGQLDDAPLQSNELTVLKASFAETILADLHKRIAYPERKRGTDR